MEGSVLGDTPHSSGRRVDSFLLCLHTRLDRIRLCAQPGAGRDPDDTGGDDLPLRLRSALRRPRRRLRCQHHLPPTIPSWSLLFAEATTESPVVRTGGKVKSDEAWAIFFGALGPPPTASSALARQFSMDK